MEAPPEPLAPPREPLYQKVLKGLLIAAALSLLIAWLVYTPPGLLGKAEAVGYAVCHRIPERSFFIGEHQTPLCARCSGMYIGAMAGFVYLWRFGRKGGMPSFKAYVVLGLLVVAFGVDGLNSYLHFFPSLPSAYDPQNWLRLATGTGMGVAIAAMLTPVFHQTVWKNWDRQPVLNSWRRIGGLLLTAAGFSLAAYTQIPLLLYPLAILASATILLILGMVYCMIWVLAFKRDNQYLTLRSLWVPLLAGFTTALLQIAVSDAIRFYLTGTWGGFQFPGITTLSGALFWLV